ncbi:MAG: 2-hydroxyacyl-CoA dehydratase family protein [Oscillospiraceae bacterium]|nr:2-hydroxyacyl-CoA dehydratase family protein [Oscillospiraceae bacterium]
MEKYIETIGSIIEKQTVKNPNSARRLLMAAYSWVRFNKGRDKGTDAVAARNRMNGAVAGMISDSFRRPEQAVMVNIFMPCEQLHAMGLQPMFPEGISVYLANTACQRVFGEAAEAADVPETFCSYHKTMIGAAETGVMPKPLMIANTTLACDANQLSFRRLAEFYHVPQTVIDVPSLVNEESVTYVADQLRTLTEQLEDLSHRKLKPEALQDAVACSRRTLEVYQDYLSRRGKITLNSTLTGELCSLIAVHIMLGRPESEKYIRDLAAAGVPRDRSKKRIFWIHVPPNRQDSMKDIFENSGRCELVGSDLGAECPAMPDPEHPYESMARRLVYCVNNGAGQRRLENALLRAKQADADGVVFFCHWGCKQTMGLAQLGKQMFEAEGLPTLVLDGDGCDARNVADGQMVTRVNAFLEQLEAGI